WHRVARVDGQVGYGLLDLPMLGRHLSESPIEVGDDLHVFSEQALQQRFHLRVELVEVEHRELEDLVTAERQELPRQQRGAGARLLDELEVSPHRIVSGQAAQNKEGATADDRQELVASVGDARVE